MTGVDPHKVPGWVVRSIILDHLRRGERFEYDLIGQEQESQDAHGRPARGDRGADIAVRYPRRCRGWTIAVRQAPLINTTRSSVGWTRVGGFGMGETRSRGIAVWPRAGPSRRIRIGVVMTGRVLVAELFVVSHDGPRFLEAANWQPVGRDRMPFRSVMQAPTAALLSQIGRVRHDPSP